MNAFLNSIQNDKTIAAGLIILIISCAVFIGTLNVYDISFDLFTGAFFVNYGLTILYFIILLFTNRKATGRYFKFSNFAHNIILLQLFNVSAYSLNRSIAVFNISVGWVACFLVISNVLLLIHAISKNYKNNWLNLLILTVSNIAILFHFYESIYVLQGYVIGVIAFWFFGIPLHIFVPALFVSAYVKVVRGFLKKSPKFWTATLATWVLTIFFIGYVSIRFYDINNTINQTFHYTQQPYQDESLPSWVLTSQKLQKDWITERALKSGMVYSNADDLFRSFGSMRINERIKHDPLVVVASFFSDGIDMSFDDKIKVLRYMYDARHQTERKFWSGDNLSTSDIVTNVQLFPQYRLAYTEKTFKIVNSQVNRRGRQQEALYTFHLPEGSVVTSAALWVNGKEESAYLTTKGKADSAYTAIVGYERRDPLLLHWQEGNRVTVRVFPCTPEEDRQFKIGVTTPLKKLGTQLKYENIDFEGPYWKGATESINVVTEGPLTNISAPFSFNENGTSYTYLGRYKSDWSFQFDALPLSEQPFSFNGKSYHLEDYQKKKTAFDAKEIYLDINNAWTKKDLNELWKTVKNKKVFVHSSNRIEQVTEANKKALFKQLRRQNFGLFPFYKIAKPNQALVISKFNQLTPTLSDLDTSGFIKNMSVFFKENTIPLRLYSIGNEISPYLRTLKEFRSIQLENGDLDQLLTNLQSNSFVRVEENDQTIVNQYGAFKITEIPGDNSLSSNAPDHLMRLFAYNDILRAVGKDYFHKKDLANELIDAAKEAYVVTPISSLIVLETQADYDRFDIKDSKNSLKNASIGNKGSVPEPHEWFLILMVLAMMIFLYFKR